MSKQPKFLCMVLLVVVAINTSAKVEAGKAAMLREAAEAAFAKLGGKTTKYTVDGIKNRLSGMMRRHGDAARIAVKKVGPQAFQLADDAGPHADAVVKLMAKRGDEAVWVVSNKNRLAIFIKHGDEAAEAMIKHQEIIEPLVKNLGSPAARAATKISTRNGRRLAIMHADKSLAKLGRTPELLRVIESYGDSAMAFIWKNKGPLAVASVMAAFLADPETFIAGGNTLVENVAENTIAPIADATGTGIANRTNWTLVITTLGVAMLTLVGLVFYQRRMLTVGRSI